MVAEISYPREILRKKPGTLEKVLLDIGQGKLPAYDDLPDIFSSTRLEPYVNWLSAQTAADPSRYEYGTNNYYSPSQRRIIYPENPTRGTYISASESTSVSPQLPEDKKAVIVNSSHTHARPTPFSTFVPQHDMSLGDLGIFAMGWRKGGETIALPTMSLGTPGDNYLLIRSSESPLFTFPQYSAALKISTSDQYMKMRNYTERLCGRIPKGRWARWFLFESVGNVLSAMYEGGFGEFFSRITDACNLAEVMKAGLYYSKKDGTYHRLTNENLEAYMKAKINEAVEEVKAWAIETSQKA